MKLTLALLFSVILVGCTEVPEQNATPKISDLQGQWVVVNYWAKWCKPCIREIPELNALHREYSQVSVLGVNFDGATGEQLATQIRELQIEFPILAQDPATELGTTRPQVLPTTLILNPAGELTQVLIGPQTLESLRAFMGR